MCEKHPWMSDILSKNRGRLTAALFKMALFHWCFAYILPVKINLHCFSTQETSAANELLQPLVPTQF